MTRRRVIAGVILLAAVVVAVPFAPGVWERVAYVEAAPLPEGSPAVGIRIRVVQGRLKLDSSTMTVLRKRRDWLPGSEYRIPDQVCSQCSTGQHATCWSRADAYTPWRGDAAVLFDDFLCTCTDPSHDGD